MLCGKNVVPFLTGISKNVKTLRSHRIGFSYRNHPAHVFLTTIRPQVVFLYLFNLHYTPRRKFNHRLQTRPKHILFQALFPPYKEYCKIFFL